MNYKVIGAITIAALITVGVIAYAAYSPDSGTLINPQAVNITPTPKPLPLLQYTFDNLSSVTPTASQIVIEEEIEDIESEDYTAYVFSYTTTGKTMTGQLNMPSTATPSAGFPVVLMIRGFVDPSIYQTGIGTQNGAGFFAENGFVTIAPDFMGYGDSDDPNPSSLGERLEKPRHLLDLMASLNSLSFINPDELVIWAHSNGGQIALSLVEITGKPIPTTLWAPVSKPFPYSILYYTDEFEDQGKALRKVVAQFEQDYDVYQYSIDKYWNQITAPIQIHQGTADDAVPVEWSTDLAETLEKLEKDVTIYITTAPTITSVKVGPPPSPATCNSSINICQNNWYNNQQIYKTSNEITYRLSLPKHTQADTIPVRPRTYP